MIAKKIESLQHPLVKEWVSLRTDRSYREESQRLLLVGKKIVCEVPIEILISLEGIPPLPGRDHIIVTEAILKKITGLEQPDGYAAVAKLPEAQDLKSKNYLLILDQISDPGNLGTLLRTALALGWEGVILTPDTVDLFNDKALRAAKGATFHLPFSRMTHAEIAQLKHHFYTADLKGSSLDKTSFEPPLALILSNETRGPSVWSEKISRKITIPMAKDVESLNVAASGAILLYAMRPK